MSPLEPLQPAEARVLGVLVEKSFTTPDGYPLSLNALVGGCNQKSARDPVTAYDDATVEAALRDLRMNHLVHEVGAAGARVPKYAHRAAERLDLDDRGLAVLAELLLRGPQTEGELRGRAARMVPLDSLDVLRPVVEGLVSRGLARRLAPASGSRAGRVVQTLAPELHRSEADAPPAAAPHTPASPEPASTPVAPLPGGADAEPRGGDLAARVAGLEAELARLRERVDRLEGD